MLTHVLHDGKDQVIKRENTDVLIEGNVIRKIAPGILDSLGPSTADHGIKIIDCVGKIVSPGFVDTHHHLWQTQLKGRHAEQNLLGIMSSGKHIALIFRLFRSAAGAKSLTNTPLGNMACYSFEPEDIYWGQLAGCLEALDAGTTTVLDHAHGCYTAEHGTSPNALSSWTNSLECGSLTKTKRSEPSTQQRLRACALCMHILFPYLFQSGPRMNAFRISMSCQSGLWISLKIGPGGSLSVAGACMLDLDSTRSIYRRTS